MFICSNPASKMWEFVCLQLSKLNIWEISVAIYYGDKNKVNNRSMLRRNNLELLVQEQH